MKLSDNDKVMQECPITSLVPYLMKLSDNDKVMQECPITVFIPINAQGA